MKIEMSYPFLIFLLACICTGPLLAQSIRSFETPLKGEELKKAVENVLEKIDSGRQVKEEETEGFAFHYSNGWFSAFAYNAYGGKAFRDKELHIIRIEGDAGDVAALSRVFELEGIIPKGSTTIENQKIYSLDSKYQFIAQPLNVVSPSLSIIYQAYSSPRLSKQQAIVRAMNYLLLDIAAYWLGGNRLFMTRHSPEKNQKYILLWWTINRGVGAVQTFNIIRGHNHVLQFGYTFPVEF